MKTVRRQCIEVCKLTLVLLFRSCAEEVVRINSAKAVLSTPPRLSICVISFADDIRT